MVGGMSCAFIHIQGGSGQRRLKRVGGRRHDGVAVCHNAHCVAKTNER